MFRKLTTWILIAAAAGVLAGWLGHELAADAAAANALAGYLSILSDVFLRLIKMIIAPLVFATVVSGIAGMGDAKAVGRIGGKALLWFVTASLVSLLLGMLLANLLQPGANLALALPRHRRGDLAQDRRTQPARFRRPLVPKSFFEAMATNEILQILIFSCFFGFAHRLAQGRARGDDHAVLPRAGRRDAEGHRLRDVGGAGRRLRRDRRRDHHAGARRAGHLRQVHRVLLHRHRRCCGRS